MTDPLHTQLQADLAPGFVIQRELHGGGMSRVFLADDGTADRSVRSCLQFYLRKYLAPI